MSKELTEKQEPACLVHLLEPSGWHTVGPQETDDGEGAFRDMLLMTVIPCACLKLHLASRPGFYVILGTFFFLTSSVKELGKLSGSFMALRLGVWREGPCVHPCLGP